MSTTSHVAVAETLLKYSSECSAKNKCLQVCPRVQQVKNVAMMLPCDEYGVCRLVCVLNTTGNSEVQEYSRLQKSCNKQAEQWKTTIDLPHMNLIIFLASACCSSTVNQLWFSTVQLACCKTFAICCTSRGSKVRRACIMNICCNHH